MSPKPSPTAEFSLDNEQPISQVPSVGATANRARSKGIYIPVTEDGKLDTTRIRDAAGVERARIALTGSAKPEAEKPVDVKPLDINPNTILIAYSLLEVVVQKAGKYFLKWPTDLTDEMHFSPEKKQALVAPTTAVIQKYSHKLGWLAENQEVTALGMALADAVNDMVEHGVLRYQLKLRDAQTVEQPRHIPPPTPIRGMSEAPAPDTTNGAYAARVSN